MSRTNPPTSQTETTNVEYVPIRVTAGILLHIGAGIYQSVAGALKELISNAYDADGSQVVVSTNYPRFDQIVVVDNGNGMTADRFRQAMRSIGSSLKAVLEESRLTPKFKRPVIGHLGIGLMALSQVCSEAVVESQVDGSETKFQATLDFSEFKRKANQEVEKIKLEVLQERYGGVAQMKVLLHKKGLDPSLREEIKAVLELISQAELEANSVEGEHLGYCLMYTDLPAVKGNHGTTITLKLIDTTVRELLSDSGRDKDTLPQPFREKFDNWNEYREHINEWSWEDLCQRLRRETGGVTYQLLPRYHQFLWELSLMTPVQYLPGGPVTLHPKILGKKRVQLERFNFSLRVDNRLLLKPILLPAGSLTGESLEERYDYLVEDITFDKQVDSERLKYTGYIFWQKNQIQPSSIRGLQIFIRNVGIGHYDDNFMNFSTVNLTSRAGQMSGEIYVDYGLERALNVDRNSFRETDEHFIALQQHLWRVLGTSTQGVGVLGKSIESYWLRKARSDELELENHISRLAQLVASAGKGRIELAFSRQKRLQPYTFGDGKVHVYNESPRWPRSKRERYESQRILIPAIVALEVGTSSRKIVELLESLILK